MSDNYIRERIEKEYNYIVFPRILYAVTINLVYMRNKRKLNNGEN